VRRVGEETAERSGFDSRVVPCGGCGADCEISGFVVALAVQLSNLCRQKGWEPMRPAEITFCPPCGVRRREAQERRTAEADALLAKLGHAVRTGASAGMVLVPAPQWFKLDYEAEISAVLSRVGKLSTRKPDRGIR
jgi:hypothetical protein